MRYSFVKTLAVVAASVLSSGIAEAAVITNTYTVVGSGFASNVPSPYASITESFTVTFDTATNVSQQTANISLNGASTIIPASTLAFTYVAVANTLIVGGTAASVATSDPNSTDFAVTIQNASNTANFSITALSYSLGTGTTFTATTRTTGTPPTPPASVPEPASLALLATAGAAFAFIRRRQSNG